MLPEDTTPAEAKAYGKRRTLELLNAIEALLEAHPDLPEVRALNEAMLHIADPFLRVMGGQEAQRFHAMTEKLAEIEHAQWAHWTEHMLTVLGPILLDNGVVREDDEQAARNALDRWRRQIKTPSAELSEAEKNSDRTWARNVLEALEGEPISHEIEATKEPVDPLPAWMISQLKHELDMKQQMFDTLSTLVGPMADAVLSKNRHDETMQALQDLLALTGDEPREVQDAAWDRARALFAEPSA